MAVRLEAYALREWFFRHGKLDHKTDAVVPQPPQKGPNCWFYALKILRSQDEISNPPSAKEKAKRREFQVVSSKRRKDQTAAEQKFLENGALVRQLKTDPNYTKSALWTKAGALAMLPRLEEIKQETRDPAALAEVEKLWNLLKPFTTQDKYDDVEEFIQHQYYKTRVIIHDVFCRRFGIDCHKGIEDVWKTWDLEHQTKRLETTAFRATFIKMGFKRADWTPKMSPNFLMNEIHARGFLYVKGHFGQMYYRTPPFKLPEKFQEQPVYGWRPGEAIIVEKNHSIVLIGVKLNSEKPETSLVYFVDPLDGSNPADHSQQKIYAMSYRRLTAEIADLVNMRHNLESKIDYSDEFGYALFNPALTETVPSDDGFVFTLGEEPMGNFVLESHQEKKGD